MSTFRGFSFGHGALLLALLSITSSIACTDRTPDSTVLAAVSPNAAESAAPVPVETAIVAVKTMPVILNAVGTVEVISDVAIRSQVTGQLRAIHFTPGQEVKQGQLLFTLDPRPFEAAVRQAEAVVARDLAQTNDAKAQRTRAADLFKRGLIPRDQFETQTAGVAALEATLAADQAQLEQVRLNLQYARIAAPMNGRTGALMAHVGDLVSANASTPLVTINQLAPIDVTFSVPARFLVDIRRYAARGPLQATASGAVATLPGAPISPGLLQASAGASFDDSEEGGAASGPSGRAGAMPHSVSTPAVEGKVTFIDNAVDPATATIALKATFANVNHNLWPGLFVQVALQLSSQPDSVVVPAVAVQASQQGPYVYVVKPDRTVQMLPVRIERQQGDDAIVSSGLSGGEEVVTDGHLRLTPGARVTTGGHSGASS